METSVSEMASSPVDEADGQTGCITSGCPKNRSNREIGELE